MTSQSESNAIPNEESRPKSKWKVTNWSEYDRALVQRGDEIPHKYNSFLFVYN
ncbi:MAG: hypothetical protein K9L60_10985 [Methylovulum sp.]|nr:hypothetical protein [Methylovulum sp.]